MARSASQARILYASAAVLLAGGLSVGGALISSESTIYDNVFKTELVPAGGGELVVRGSSMAASFTGAVGGELASEYYTLTNVNDAYDIRFNLKSRQQPGGNKALELAEALSTRVSINGVETRTGSLHRMSIPAAHQVTLSPGESVVLRLDVFVEDRSAFLAAGLGADARVAVDFLFDAIYLS